MASANIFLGMMPKVRSMADYSADLDEADTRRNANAIQALTLQRATRADQEAAADQSAYEQAAMQAGGDENKLIAALRASSRPSLVQQAGAMETAAAERRNKLTTANKAAGETLDAALKRYRGVLDFIDGPQGAARWVHAQYSDPATAEFVQRFGPVEQSVSSIPSDPQAFEQWRQRQSMGLEKFLQEQRLAGDSAQRARNDVIGPDGRPNQTLIDVKKQIAGAGASRVSVGYGAPMAGVDDNGNPVFFQPEKGGGKPAIVPGVRPAPKPMSDSSAEKFASNAVTLQKIDSAIEAIEKTPDALGLKNYLPDAVVQRVDPAGVDVRAMVADIAGQKIHDRSGAAVTVGEAERLRPYIPNPTDNPKTAIKKLKLFRAEYAAMQQALATGANIKQAAAKGAATPVGGASDDDILKRADAIIRGGK